MGKKQQKLKQIIGGLKKVAKAAKAVEGAANAPLRTLGGAVGAKLGSRRTGEKVGAFFGKIAGSGDYTVSQNSISRAGFATDSVPQFRASSRGTRITHREYLGDVIASSDGSFSIQSYALQPGLFSSFPWLASFATQFDEWIPNGIVYCYKPTSSFYSGTANLGTVILATDYDVTDTAYSSKLEMENSQFAVSVNCASAVMHPIECKMSERMSNCLFTRAGSVSDSLRFYDLGNFQIATVGCAANQNCGELWVTYDITLLKPQLFGGISGGGILAAQYSLTGVDNTHPLGTAATISGDSTLTTLTVTATTITFPLSLVGGTFVVAVRVTGTAASIVAPSLTLANGLVGVSTADSTKDGMLASASSGNYSAGTAVSAYFWLYTLKVTQPTTAGTVPTLTFGTGGTLPSSVSSAQLCVTQAPRGGY